MLLLLPHRICFSVHHFLLHRNGPAFGARGPFKDRGTPLTYSSESVPPSPHYCGLNELKFVYLFIYLGYIITSNSKIDKKVDNRQAKASRGNNIETRVVQKTLEERLKISVYRAIILANLLFDSEL